MEKRQPMIRLAAIAGAVLLALLALSNWQRIRAEKALRKAETALDAANATITAERENTRKANDSAKRYQTRSEALEADKRNNPLPPVRLCKRPASVPQAGASPGADEAPKADNPPEDEGDRDIGPELDEFATDAEANLNQCQELQRWVLER